MFAMAVGAQDEAIRFVRRAVADGERVFAGVLDPFGLRPYPAFDELRRRVGL
jgi:hypothetical protein